MTKVLIPIPSQDFDPTEVSVPWYMLKQAGIDVTFATPDGAKGHADELMVTGKGLDVWGWIPLLNQIKLFGLLLRASGRARKCHAALLEDPSFQNPLSYASIKHQDFDGLILPGGHAPRMRAYLEDEVLQQVVVDFFEQPNDQDKMRPVGAICHGVVLAARSISKQTGKSVLFGKKTTALTWKLESSAWDLTRFLARFWDPHYYRTYMEKPGEPKGYRGVEAEVTRALERKEDFIDVPNDASHHHLKTAGLFRDDEKNDKPAFIVEDGHYISARWPGDSYTFAKALIKKLKD